MGRGVIISIVAFGVGLIAGALLIPLDGGGDWAGVPPESQVDGIGSAALTDAREPATPEESTTPSPAEDAAALEEENRELRVQIDELEEELASAREKLAAGDGAEAPGKPESAPADLEAEFADLAKGGLGAYAGAAFKDFVERLKEMGPEAQAFLYDLLDNTDDATSRFLAAAALEGIGDPVAIPALSEVLVDEGDLIVRRMASHAIALIGTDAALEPLRKSMQNDADWGVRVNSAYGVAKAGGEDGLEYLQDAYLSEETPNEYLLGILGGLADVGAPSTAPMFRKILGDTKDPTYLFIAIGALKKMKDRESLPELRKIVDSDLPESIRNAAAEAIAELE